jgi:hypothetical protein
MNYTLLNVVTTNAVFTANEDGSVTAKNVIAQIGIVGVPDGKFIQTDRVPAFSIPSSTTTAQQPAYIDAQVQAYVTATYPNT